MSGILRAGVVLLLVSWAGVASAASKKADSLDDLFAAIDKSKSAKGSRSAAKASSTKASSAHAQTAKSSSKSKVVKGEGRAAKIKSPQRAAVAPAPADDPAATADVHGGAATPEQMGLVLVEYAPERHALAGP